MGWITPGKGSLLSPNSVGLEKNIAMYQIFETERLYMKLCRDIPGPTTTHAESWLKNKAEKMVCRKTHFSLKFRRYIFRGFGFWATGLV